MEMHRKKNVLREKVKNRLTELHRVRGAFDHQIRHRLIENEDVRNADVVMGYFPMKDEVDLFPLYFKLLSRGKTLVFPRVDPHKGCMTAHRVSDLSADSTVGSFGLREPLSSSPKTSRKEIDVIVVPGLAFTETGQRLGRGGGFYDRFLDGYRGSRVAAAYEQQLLPEVPFTEHDQTVDTIVTPGRSIAAASR